MNRLENLARMAAQAGMFNPGSPLTIFIVSRLTVMTRGKSSRGYLALPMVSVARSLASWEMLRSGLPGGCLLRSVSFVSRGETGFPDAFALGFADARRGLGLGKVSVLGPPSRKKLGVKAGEERGETP